jgi:hypothetical protein
VVRLCPRLQRLKLLGSALFVLLPIDPGFLHAVTVSQDIHFSELPLAFEANSGQYRPDIKFVGRNTYGTILLTATGATLQFSDWKRRASPLKMIPVDASAATIEGVDESSGKANYFGGRNPAHWVTNVPRYFTVRYRHIYPGIDLIFHGSQTNLEYDFIVSPGADPNHIKLDFSGADSVKLKPNGDLVVTTADGLTLTHHSPVVFQEENGVRKRTAGAYVLRGRNHVAFQIASYVRSQTLVIDPVVGYSALFGGSSSGFPFAITADASGNAYVTGSTMLASFPVLPGSFEVGNTTQNAVFVYKLNSSGTDFEYTTLIGGSSAQYGTGITVDASGNAYVTGVTSSADFPVTSGAFQTTLPTSNNHGFVLKLNAAGSALLYCTFLAGNFPDLPAAIAIDTSGNAYITGATESSTFPVTMGAYQTSRSNPDGEAFVTELNSIGTALVYSTYLDNSTGGNAIALDNSGNAYITGATNVGGVVTKMNPTGSGLVYEVSLNAGTGSFVNGIAVDTSGNAYVAGTGTATLIGDPMVYGSHPGIFVAKLNAAGNAISYLTSLGGNGVQQTAGLALDSAGNVYVTGWTNAPDFPLLSPVQAVGTSALSSAKTGILFKLDPTGSLSYSTYFGSNYDTPIAIAVDPNSNVFLAGEAISTLFPVTPGAVDQTQPDADGNVFVAEVSPGQTCNFSFSSLTDQEPIAGGNGSISVTAPAGCNWIALAGQTWILPSEPGIIPLAMPGITVTSPSAGAGSGAVTYSVPPNTSPARTTTLSIAGTLITVSQPDGCTYQFSSSAILVSAAGGNITNALQVTTSYYCQFTVLNLPAWLSNIVEGPYTGATTFNPQVAPNTGSTPRSAVLIIAGLPFVVNQAAGLQSCNFAMTPSQGPAPATGAFGTFQVSTSSGCSWDLTSNSSWLQITSISSSYGDTSTAAGTGNGTVYYTVQPNTGTSARSGTLTINGTGPALGVTQAYADSPPPSPSGFYPLTPCRVVDTRSFGGKTGAFGPPFITGGSERDFPLPLGSCNLPANGTAYSLNITVVPHSTLGYLTVWPTGGFFPTVSTLNSLNGRVVANAAIVPAGVSGSISVYASDDTDVFIDVNGYFASPGSQSLAFYPVSPCRVADTRSFGGFTGAFGPPTMTAGEVRDFPITSSSCNIPATAQAYALNMTVSPATTLTFLTTWPAGGSFPTVSTLNDYGGGLVANAAIVPAGTNGDIDVYVTDASDVIIDINGYFAPPGSTGALNFYTLLPCRVADTRSYSAMGGAFGPPSIPGGTARDFPVMFSFCGVPQTAQAYSLNVTAWPSGPVEFLTVWPEGQPFPTVSTLNAPTGQVVANAAIIPAGPGTGGDIEIYVSNTTDIFFDINGYFGP